MDRGSFCYAKGPTKLRAGPRVGSPVIICISAQFPQYPCWLASSCPLTSQQSSVCVSFGCQEPCENPMNQRGLVSLTKETAPESCPWVSFYGDNSDHVDPQLRRKREQIGPPVSPRLAFLILELFFWWSLTWCGLAKCMLLSLWWGKALNLDPDSQSTGSEYRDILVCGSRLHACIQICYKFVYFPLLFGCMPSFFLFYFHCIIAKNKWSNSVACRGSSIMFIALLLVCLWGQKEVYLYFFSSELPGHLGFGKIKGFP